MGLFPVDGFAIRVVYVQMPWLEFGNGWIVACPTKKLKAVIRGHNINSTDVPTETLIRH